jgi:hypothetical protein
MLFEIKQSPSIEERLFDSTKLYDLFEIIILSFKLSLEIKLEEANSSDEFKGKFAKYFNSLSLSLIIQMLEL